MRRIYYPIALDDLGVQETLDSWNAGVNAAGPLDVATLAMAIKAIQQKVGVTDSQEAASLDAMLAALTSRVLTVEGLYIKPYDSPTLNALTLLDYLQTPGPVYFGGRTSSYPMLKRTSNYIEVRKADDSDYAEMYAGTFGAISYIRIGSGGHAAAGGIRIPNNIAVAWRNAGNTADESVKVNASNQLEISPSLALTGKVVKYNNVATAEMGVAPILEYVFMDAYDTSQAWANFTNASTAGMYRVSVYYKLNTIDIGVNTLHVDIRWNGGGQSYTGETLTLSGTSVYKQYTAVFYHTGGGSVQHQAVLTVNSGSADTYDAHLTIERLT